MKALFRLQSAIHQTSFMGLLALMVTVPWLYPAITVRAAELQASGQPALIFKINPQTVLQNQSSISLQQIVQKDPLAADLQAYLASYNSPFADYTTDLLKLKNWKTIIAVSFVESNMGIHHYYYNSSGIGGQKYLRRYDGYVAWMQDMDQIITDHYNGWTLDKMNGVWVQPKSSNWLYGSKKIMNELDALEQQASQERTQLALNNLQLTSPTQLAMANTK